MYQNRGNNLRKVYYDVVMYVNEALKGCGEPYNEATLQPLPSLLSPKHSFDNYQQFSISLVNYTKKELLE